MRCTSLPLEDTIMTTELLDRSSQIYTINAFVTSYFHYMCLRPLDCELSEGKEYILLLFAFPKSSSEDFKNKWMEETIKGWQNKDLLKFSWGILPHKSSEH